MNESDSQLNPSNDFKLSSFLDPFKNKSTKSNYEEEPLEYLFDDELTQGGANHGPSWGSRLCYGTGTVYLMGLFSGGVWGLAEGISNPIGKASNRLRLNCVLNGMTARGPFLGNSLGILALYYNLIHGGLIYARNGKSDTTSALASGLLTGFSFRCLAGVKQASLAALVCGSAVLSMQAFKAKLNNESLFS